MGIVTTLSFINVYDAWACVGCTGVKGSAGAEVVECLAGSKCKKQSGMTRVHTAKISYLSSCINCAWIHNTFSPTFCLETLRHLPQLLPLGLSGMTALQLLRGQTASLRDLDDFKDISEDQADTEQSGQGLWVVGLVSGKTCRRPP